jgi:hypothetical protein
MWNIAVVQGQEFPVVHGKGHANLDLKLLELLFIKSSVQVRSFDGNRDGLFIPDSISAGFQQAFARHPRAARSEESVPK